MGSTGFARRSAKSWRTPCSGSSSTRSWPAASSTRNRLDRIADLGNQTLLLIGSKRIPREATPLHPFGDGRERYAYAFIVSVVLAMGGLHPN